MGSLHIHWSFPGLCCSPALTSTNSAAKNQQSLRIHAQPQPAHDQYQHRRNRFLAKPVRAVEIGTSVVPTREPDSTAAKEESVDAEPPSIDFAFVNSRLLPDGSPDIQIRSACGGQKLRDIMLDNNIELYGPYARFLLNCAGGGTCGTCLVEVIEGKELLSPKTDKEKEALKRKPKTWRLACQTVVGKPDSRGQVAIQQLPEWKVHEWEQ